MARFLMFGGTGFLGLNLAVALSRAGHAVTVATRQPLPPDSPLMAAAIPTMPLALDDHAGVAAALDRLLPDQVLHLASSIIPSSPPSAYFAERAQVLTPTLVLARELAERGIALGYVSSGGTVYGPSKAGRLAEDAPCRPISYYGHAKLEAEQHLRFVARTEGLRCLILRLSNPYGRFQRLDGQQGLVSVALGAIRQGSTLPVWGDGKALRDYLYIDDFCAAAITLLDAGAQGTINVGSGEGHTLLEVVAAVERATGRHLPLDFRAARRVDVPRVVLDVTRLEASGARFTRPLDAGIRAYARELGLAE